MPEIILICGKICSGKTTYAKKLCRQRRAVLLSVDEIMLSMFGQHCGDMHDTYAERTRNYLLEKAAELYEEGIGAVLDWGFWTKDGREVTAAFFRNRGIPYRLYYIDVPENIWRERLEKRNREVLEGSVRAYYVDENLAAKFEAVFQMPDDEEIDCRITE